MLPMLLLLCLLPPAASLSPLPPGLNEFTRLSGRGGVLSAIRRSVAAATGRALADGQELLEIEFPPLLETKTQFDDFSNVEVLDANRDFAVQLAVEPEVRAAAADASLWVCFADQGEAELAIEAWPGAMYGAATQTYITAAVRAVGQEPLMPMGSGALSAANALSSLFGGAPPPPPPAPPPPALQLIVQPGDGGPMEDWLNLEFLQQEGVPMVCLNGALDKVTSGYYSNFLNPKLGECAERFFSRFEQVYYLKPIGSGRGWLYRVYPEPWQCVCGAPAWQPARAAAARLRPVRRRSRPLVPRAGSTVPRATTSSCSRRTRCGRPHKRPSTG
jgi:hypothetical protein